MAAVVLGPAAGRAFVDGVLEVEPGSALDQQAVVSGQGGVVEGGAWA